MSTTVIASRHGVGLYLAPWRPGDVDVPAVRAAAAEHGVDLFDADLLNTRHEAIVAAGLEPDRASRLAAALRQQGLTVRVVNDPKITQSMRLSNALGLMLFAIMFLWPLVFPAILAAINAVVIGAGGLVLPVAGAPDAHPPVATKTLARIQALSANLPAHVLEPLLAQARDLAREASADPAGPAARALEEVLADLDADEPARIEQSARSLRAGLAQARRAAREVP